MKHLHQNFATVGLLGCARKSVTQQPTSSPVAENPAVASSEGSATPPQTAQTSPISVLSSGSFVSGEHPTQGTA